jgi:HEPN domain-containing protein
MKKYAKHLPAKKRDCLNQIKQIILSVCRPDKIILFGLYADETLFANISQYPSRLQVFDLLVIVKGGDSREHPELQRLIEDKCYNIAQVNCVVHHLKYVNERLMEGSFFLYRIQEEGIVLYDGSQLPLSKAAAVNFQILKQRAEEDYRDWSTQAKQFYDCATFSKQYGYHRLSIFLLHQAAEQMYMAIILTFTGYKPTTHNLGKLRKHTARLSLQLCSVFPDRTDDDQRIFHLLTASYVDARYAGSFDVNENDLLTLFTLVGRLLTLGETLCLHQLTYLNKLAAEQNKPELSAV